MKKVKKMKFDDLKKIQGKRVSVEYFDSTRDQILIVEGTIEDIDIEKNDITIGDETSLVKISIDDINRIEKVTEDE